MNNQEQNLKHLGIIMDGNRRWARAHNLPTLAGHRRGYQNIKTIANYAFKQGVEILTIYAFSTENWQREKKEVEYLLKLFKILIDKEFRILMKNGVKVNFFGRRADFDRELQSGMKRVELETRNNTRGILNICLSYGGRDEIVRAVKKIIDQKIALSEISENLIAANLDSAGLPDPDLIIRTSGEQRLSGFLTWQSAYSEFLFVKHHWPDFSKKDFDRALADFNSRQRRFGK